MGLSTGLKMESKVREKSSDPSNRGNRSFCSAHPVPGKFRHLPVVENGEVIALLDITKCLYDAISRMQKAAEQGSAIAAAVEGVECQWGNNLSAPSAFIKILRERMFKPALLTIISENAKVAMVSPSDPVQVADTKMLELRVNSVIVITGNNM